MTALIKQSLEAGGYSVTACNSAEEAMEVLTREDFDVVISDLHVTGGPQADVMLPGADNSLPAKIRALKVDMPLIVVSGDPEGARLTVEGLADDYLPKPFDLHQLTDAIERLVQVPYGSAMPSELSHDLSEG